MIFIVSTVALVVGFLIGYFIAVYLIARDPDVLKLEQDQIIVQKPSDGLMLVAAPPEIVRRLVMSKDREGNPYEARDLYRPAGLKKELLPPDKNRDKVNA